MKILFCLHKPNRLRNFERLIAALAERGHDVAIAYVAQKKGLRLPASLTSPRIRAVPCPSGRGDLLAPLVDKLRIFRDYLRYLDDGYLDAVKLRQRAINGVNFFLTRYLGTATGKRYVPFFRRLMARVETWIPSDRGIEKFLRQHSPDIVLVSPLVQKSSAYQTEFIKSSRRLGIPCAFLPFSWDNLTNKGLMRIQPHRVLVWNETQKDEAVRLHGADPANVAVCGAWRFDEFFDLKPSVDKATFCRNNGLNPDRPYIVYLCSSEFTAPREEEFVIRWLKEIRSSQDSALKECGVLFRPYPDTMERWSAVDLTAFPNAAVHRDAGWGKAQGLFDALHHASAVFGINTSAMIEAAIAGKPVHTLLVPEFQGGQAGTIHFHYFTTVGGGLLHVARNFDDLRSSLAASLRSMFGYRDERSDRFVKEFVRPRGLSAASTPDAVLEIERCRDLARVPDKFGAVVEILRLATFPLSLINGCLDLLRSTAGTFGALAGRVVAAIFRRGDPARRVA